MEDEKLSVYFGWVGGWFIFCWFRFPVSIPLNPTTVLDCCLLTKGTVHGFREQVWPVRLSRSRWIRTFISSVSIDSPCISSFISDVMMPFWINLWRRFSTVSDASSTSTLCKAPVGSLILSVKILNDGNMQTRSKNAVDLDLDLILVTNCIPNLKIEEIQKYWRLQFEEVSLLLLCTDCTTARQKEFASLILILPMHPMIITQE